LKLFGDLSDTIKKTTIEEEIILVIETMDIIIVITIETDETVGIIRILETVDRETLITKRMTGIRIIAPIGE
jgi:hypothetical protein